MLFVILWRIQAAIHWNMTHSLRVGAVTRSQRPPTIRTFIRQPLNISAQRWLIYKHRDALAVQGEYIKGLLFLS